MKTYLVETEDTLLAHKVRLADSFLTRFRGLMFRKSLAPGEGLLLKNCGSIHCCFMRFPIDVVYLDREYRVLRVETVRPWRLGSLVRGAKHVLEIGADCGGQLHPGDRLTIREGDKV